MRHYGKDGPQCRPLVPRHGRPARICRLAARAVLFGRVPRSAVLWMGSVLLLAVIAAGVACVASVDPRSPVVYRETPASLVLDR
jgi:hypothetical protein